MSMVRPTGVDLLLKINGLACPTCPIGLFDFIAQFWRMSNRNFWPGRLLVASSVWRAQG